MVGRVIVFDLDGTLVDTAPDLVDTLNVVFSRGGLRPLPYQTARNLIGGGARAMIERGIKAQGRNVVTAEVERLFQDFISYYSGHLADRSRPFPGLIAALDRLAGDGWRFAVCTNKLEALSVKLLDRVGLVQRFDVICGQDTFGVRKPDPEMLRRTLAAADGAPANALMVGDSIDDIRTARAAGVPIIAVDFGYTERPIAECGPDRVIGAFADLPNAVAALFR